MGITAPFFPELFAKRRGEVNINFKTDSFRMDYFAVTAGDKEPISDAIEPEAMLHCLLLPEKFQAAISCFRPCFFCLFKRMLTQCFIGLRNAAERS